MRRKVSGNIYQSVLIGSGILATLLFGLFFYRELFPEYKIYQDDYVELEKFKTTYSGEPLPPFQPGIKQIVLEKENKGPAEIDRCISCHVALQFEHFSPTKLQKDSNGKILYDENGIPLKTVNKNYVFSRLDEKIKELGETPAAAKLAALKTAHVGEHVYDVTKVLQMHPLIGKEIRPFQYHPLEEYGCTVCHSGNGRGLTTEKAHGPIFDGEYETENMGPKKEFLEKDTENAPLFSKVFNHKPGHKLLFMTTPLFVGKLIEAKCIQCHKPDVSPSITSTYSRGETLFIAQGCYACHRIAGISRAGVGPELSKEGLKYPWFIKESIVWPQADLKTSNMPNMRLDHEELEALTTFLLAQTGKRKSDSDIGYKVAIQEWEGGKKNPWEEPVPPAKLNELNYALTVFATEGCAACHRLKGIVPAMEDGEWFKKFFPEEISGSEIVKAIDKNKAEITERLTETPQFLEELEKSHPGLIESYYSNFKYASRASDNDLVRRVLMAYIGEYGLGRLIGPRPNWSGVYRSDEWLMEHFRNPGALVPRSIMPIFPFDDTKFYALTKMLDTLGIRNRDALKKAWSGNFNPELAYQELCAQCHGDHLQGNGPVAEWIYPIPKNLRNANFLRNLTKEKAFDSIMHGVKGTPMPPWGEVGEGKQSEAVLTDKEVHDLVDWLYASIPHREVSKWNYSGEDAQNDLRKNDLDGETLFTGNMIKEKFYTKENLENGQRLFDLNCAACHGKDADGRGLRAEAMVDAKPRMLTNLNWINTKDDLYLLRSIKFGVPGTSMTPWGDVTSGLQRAQLVMYIRSLSNESGLKEKLAASIYKTFDLRIQALEQARSVLKNAEIDGKMLSLIETIKKEKQEFHNAGSTLIGSGSEALDDYIALLPEINPAITFANGKLILHEEKSDGDVIERLTKNKKLSSLFEARAKNSQREQADIRIYNDL